MAGPLGELFDHGCDAINTTVRLPSLEPRRDPFARAATVSTSRGIGGVR